ncbi:endonuclease G, mitochondrial [Cryptococcus neoformans c45]|nr:endonuclease G, mitochondrial [Cryptococcus neoformans var. grubii c45]
MPTLGPSLLFVAGLTLGVGAGTFLPRKASQPNVPLPPPPPEGGRPDFKESKALVPTATGIVGPLQGGFPGPTPDIIKRVAYTAAYDRRLRHPAWTAEHITATSLAKVPPPQVKGTPVPLEAARAADTSSQPEVIKADRSKSVFKEDDGIPKMFRAKLSDYFRSGYDRGHMVPAADAKISQQAMDETFYLSNIAPQVGDGFNRHYWAYVEDFCRRLTTNFEDVYVFTVPLYLPEKHADGKWRVSYEVIGNPPSVSVPTHFAKVILASRPDFSYPQKPSSTSNAVSSPQTVKELALGAFVLPNKEIPDQADLRSFIVPVEHVEKAAGLKLFNEEVKTKSRQLCAVTQCQVIVRRFDDARKQLGGKK